MEMKDLHKVMDKYSMEDFSQKDVNEQKNVLMATLLSTISVNDAMRVAENLFGPGQSYNHTAFLVKRMGQFVKAFAPKVVLY